MKKFTLLSIAILIGQLVLSASAMAKTRVLTFNTYEPSTHYLTHGFEHFAADVYRETHHQIKIVIYPGATLTKASGVFDGLLNGVSDIGFSAAGYTPGRFPLMETGDLPFTGVKSDKQLSWITWELYNHFKPKEFSKIKVLGFVNMARSMVQGNVPIHKLSDMKGLRIRGTGNDVQIIKDLGATPVAMPITDTFVALQKGVVDGGLLNYAGVLAFKLGPVVKYTLDFPFRNTVFWYGMSMKTYKSLTPFQQKVITRLGEKYVRIQGAAVDAADLRGITYLKKLGHKWTKLDPGQGKLWEAALKPSFGQYIKAKSAMGLPAKQAVDFVWNQLKK